MSRFEEIVFPKRLHRIPYLIRIVIADICLWLLLSTASPSDPTFAGLRLVAICLGAFIIGIYSLFFVLLPRVRNAGWSGWWVLVGLLPYIGPLFHFALLFIPPTRDVVHETIYQSMKPTAPSRYNFSVFAITPCRGLSLSR